MPSASDMWRRATYVVTIFDPDSGKIYRHQHNGRKDADIEVFEAKRWGFVAWVASTQRDPERTKARDRRQPKTLR
jgi:hypothetical protein